MVSLRPRVVLAVGGFAIGGFAVGALGVVGCSSFSGTDAGGAGADGGETATPACDAGPGTRACNERYVYITANGLRGDFGADAAAGQALAVADAFCATEANRQTSYPDLQNRTWRAWMCTPMETATGRAATTDARWISPERTLLFPTLDALRARSPTNPVGPHIPVWTGCGSDGTVAQDQSCSSWTTEQGVGATGLADSPNQGWSGYGILMCTAPSPIYCFEHTD